MITLRVVMLGCLMLGASGAAEEPDKPAGDSDEKAARMGHMKQAAKSYEVALTSDRAKKLLLMEEPLLRFDDPVTGVVDGTVFLWMFEGRPAAIASVWIRKTGHEFHEFTSLSESALSASNQGQERWTPTSAGIERESPAIKQPPAATAVARLKQMRAFAGEHSARVAASDKDEQELRLLPQPVHRYGRADGPVVYGAIFAYCKGTNPEVLLLVEAVKSANGLEWSQTFARMTSRKCEVRRDDKEVWTAPRVYRGSPTDPYFNVVQRYNGPGGP